MARGPRAIRLQPLWVRVDGNRVRLGVFVVLYVVGSAFLLTSALIAVPGSLAGVLLFDPAPSGYWHNFLIVWAASFGVMLAFGGLFAAIQLSNAEHWVRGRMLARDLRHGEAADLVEAVKDMSIAAGLAEAPRIAVTTGTKNDVNAFALGTTRNQPLIGVTPGFLTVLSQDEQRAVVAVLIARIIAGDIMFGTALAALMGPIKAVRESPGAMDRGCTAALGGKPSGKADTQRSSSGCDPGCFVPDGCGDGCGDLDEGIGGVVIVIVIAAITYVAVLGAAWIVTLWGRVLQRTAQEKADAEGMLLLKDPAPMLSAFRKTARASNEVADCDPSYDGIFYTATSGKPRIERVEERRYRRLREVVGVDGLAAEELAPGEQEVLSTEEWAMQQLAPPEPLGPPAPPPAEQPSEPPGPFEPPTSGT